VSLVPNIYLAMTFYSLILSLTQVQRHTTNPN
jgi:hypothetical protein